MGHLIQLFVALGGFIDKLTAGSPAVGGGDAAADRFAEAGLTPADVAAVKELIDGSGGVGAALRVQQKALCGERPDGSDANRSEGEEDEDLYEDATPLFDMNEVIHSLTLPDNAVHINRFAARLMSQSGVNASDLLGEDEEEATPVGASAVRSRTWLLTATRTWTATTTARTAPQTRTPTMRAKPL